MPRPIRELQKTLAIAASGRQKPPVMVVPTGEPTMTKPEYDDLLDIVENAINTNDCDMAFKGDFRRLVPANDNQLEWPLMPFPMGWHASP